MYKLKSGDLNKCIEVFAKMVCVVQLVFALVWLVLNGGVVQSDSLANCYIEAGNTLVVDNHMGILYALLVRLLGGGVLLHFVQLAIVFAVSYLTLGVLGALLVSGNLYVLQICFTTRPEALFLSCIFLFVFAVRKMPGKAPVLTLLGVSAVSMLLNPQYVFISFPAFIVMGLVYAVKKKREAISFFAVAVTSLVLFFAVNSFICTPYAYGRSAGSVSYYKMQRVVWPYVLEFNNVLKQYYDIDMQSELHEAEKNAEMLSYFAGKLEMKLGAGAADEFYDRMSDVYYKHGIGYLLKPIVKDMGMAFFAPFTVPGRITGNASDPTFARVTYMLIGKCNFFFTMYIYFFAVSTAILSILAICRAITEKNLAVSMFVVLIFFVSLYSTFICTRDFDYRNVSFCLCGWQILFLLKKKEEV